MLSFLLLVIVVFVLWPLLVAGWKIFRQVRTMHRFMNDPMGEMRRQAERQNRRRSDGASGNPFASWFTSRASDGDSPGPRRRGKKIPRDIGEYISFTEIKLSEQELKAYFERTATRVRGEEQITDIRWTDL